MERRNEQQIFNDLYQILQQMDDDISLSDDFFPESRLVADLGFESIDIVVFCTTIEGHFQQQFPFARFLAEVGQRDEREAPLAGAGLWPGSPFQGIAGLGLCQSSEAGCSSEIIVGVGDRPA